MSIVVRRVLPNIIISIIIILMILFYYFYIDRAIAETFSKWDKALSDWAVIIMAFGLMIGGVDIFKIYIGEVKRRGVRQAPYSIIAVIFMLITVIFALHGFALSYIDPTSGITITTQPQFKWIYTYIFAPCSAAMFSILIFYIASASYRAYRVRNLPALLLLIAALIVMLGNTTIGPAILPPILALRDWVMTVPNTGAFRPITIGVGFGIIITGLRMLTWKEVSWIGRRE